MRQPANPLPVQRVTRSFFSSSFRSMLSSRFSPRSPLVSVVPDNRKSILLADVSHVSKLRTTYLRFVRHSPLSFARNSLERDSKECPKYVFFFFSFFAFRSTVHSVHSRFRYHRGRVRRPFRANVARNLNVFDNSIDVV